MEEPKTFYQQAEDFYNLAKVESDFFEQRPLLKSCVEYLLKAYKRQEIETIEGLPKDPSMITHFDKPEASGLIGILDDFFLTEEDFITIPADLF